MVNTRKKFVAFTYVLYVQGNQLFSARKPSPTKVSITRRFVTILHLTLATRTNARLIFYEDKESDATTIERHRDSIRARLTGLMNT